MKRNTRGAIIGGHKELFYKDSLLKSIPFEEVLVAQKELKKSIVARGGTAPKFSLHILTNKPAIMLRGICYLLPHEGEQ